MFKIVKEEGIIYPPLLIKTYEADCVTQLRKNLLVTHIDEVRGEHNIKFSPITNRENICIKVDIFGQNTSNTESVIMQSDRKGQIIITPLYAF